MRLAILIGMLFSLSFLGFWGVQFAYAGCVTGDDGWVVCTNSDGSQTRATTCDQLSGIGTETCGAGSGCGPTGCYNCASKGNCGGGRRRRREIVARLDMFIMTVPLAQTPVSLGKKWSDCKTGVIIFSVALNIMIVPPIQEHMRSVPIVGIQVVGETHVKEVCSVVVADMSLAGTLFAQLEMIGRVSVGMDIGMRVVVS